MRSGGMESAMTDQAQIIALTSEAQALHAEVERLRIENNALRVGQVEARHHIAMALRALNGDAPSADTHRFHNGG